MTYDLSECQKRALMLALRRVGWMSHSGDLVPDAVWRRLAGSLHSFRSCKRYGCVESAQTSRS